MFCCCCCVEGRSFMVFEVACDMRQGETASFFFSPQYQPTMIRILIGRLRHGCVALLLRFQLRFQLRFRHASSLNNFDI